MATLIDAVREYGPRIVRGNTVQDRELLKLLAARTGLKDSEISLVIKELRSAIIFFAQSGRGLRIEDLGTYLPYIRNDGYVKLSYRLDPEIKYQINMSRDFLGEIANRENIGKTTEELIELWNTDHPDDPVTLN